MIRTLSENVIMPIAGIILTFIACYELIQLVISRNNLAHSAMDRMTSYLNNVKPKKAELVVMS